MSKLAEYLNRRISGNVFEQDSLCNAYSEDRSILKISPEIVAFPESSTDVRRLLQFLYQLAIRELVVPVTVRGTGLDKTGAAIGESLILSTERLNHIEEVDVRGRLVRVQPGVTLEQLNDTLRPQGLWLPIHAHPRSTIGGLIANGITDDYAARYGGITQAVEQIEIVLSNGELILLAPFRQREIAEKIASNSTEGILYRKIDQILEDHADIILDRSMQAADHAGYGHISHLRDGGTMNLLPLFFGSQGTLGVITDIILHLELLPDHPRRFLASFHDLRSAENFLNVVDKFNPYLLRVYDLRIFDEALKAGKKSELLGGRLGKGIAVLFGFDYNRVKTNKCIAKCLEVVPENVLCIEETSENTAEFQKIDQIMENFLNPNTEDTGQRLPLVDDTFIPSAEFKNFANGLKVLEETFDVGLPIYGSFVTENYSIRPIFDNTSLDNRKQMTEFIRMYHNLVSSCQGSITGNSPEGRVKALITSKTLSIGERAVYSAIKEVFDPQNLLNPNIKLGARTADTLRHLKTKPKNGLITL